MSGILVIEERDAIAEILVARLRESPFVKHCRRIRTPETHSLDHKVCALAGALRDENVDAVVYSPSRLAPLRMTPNLTEAAAFLKGQTGPARAAALADYCQVLFCLNEFLYAE